MPFGGTVKLTGESEYKKALADITRSLKEVSSETKAVTSSYDKEDKSQKAVTEQSKALNKQLDVQNQKIELMKKHYDQLAKSEGASEEELSKLRTQINNAQADANKTAAKIKELGNETDAAGGKFSGMGEKIGSFAKVAAASLAAVGTAAAAMGKKLYDAAKETAAMGDEIDKESQKLGISAETYQTLNYAMERSGSSISDLSKGVKTITQSLADAQNGVEGATEQFDSLGVSVKNTDGTFKSAEDILLGTIDALANMEDETQRNAAAQEIFGKSASELNPLLNAGADAIKALQQEAKDYGMVMSDEAVAASAAFSDSMDKLQGTATGLKTKLVSDLLPGLTQVANGFADLLNGSSGAGESIQAGFESMIGAINDRIPEMVEVIQSVVSAVVAVAPDIIKGLAESLLGAIPDLIPVISDAIKGIGSVVIELIPEVLEAIPELLSSIVEGSLDIVRGLWDSILETFFGIENEYKNVVASIDEQNRYIREQASAFAELEPRLANYNLLISDSGKTLAELDSEIKKNEDAITEVISKALEEQGTLRAEDLEDIANYNQKILELQAEKLEIYRSQQISALKKLELETGTVSQEGAAQHLATMKASLEQANNATEEAYTARLTEIERKYAAMNQIGSEAYKVELRTAKYAHDQELTENQSYYDRGLAILQESAKQWVMTDADKWATLSEQMSNFNMETDDGFRKFQLQAQEWSRGFDTEKENYLEALSMMDRYSANGFLNMAASIKATGGEIDDETKVLAENILQSFDNLPEDLDDAGKKALSGLIVGLDDEIPALKDASKMSANEIVDVIKEYLGIHSPSTVLEEVGQNASLGLQEGIKSEEANLQQASQSMVTVVLSPFQQAYNEMYAAGASMADGVWYGFSSKEWALTQNVRSMMQRVTSAVRSEMQIHSPSKVFAKIGDFMAQGLGEGFTDEMKTVTSDITNSIPKSLDVQPSGGNMSLVDQFKEALSEMKIVLDDEEVGAFVDKTVTNIVYN